MKKVVKRTLAFVLALIIVAGVIPVPAQAATKKVAVKQVTLNYSQYVMKKGQKLKLKATVSPKKAKTTLKWKSSNKKIATVTSKGVVTAKGKKGRATITVTAGKKKATCKVIIGTAVKKITASNMRLTAGKSAKIKASISPSKATVKTLIYKSSNTRVAKVDKKGKVTAIKQGKAKITITAADCRKVKKTITVTVTKAANQNATPEVPNKPSPEVPDESSTEVPDEPSPEVPDGEYIITLYDGENKIGEEVMPVGSALTDIKAPYVDGKVFLGWYYDISCTKKVNNEDVVNGNISLYGNYGEAIPITEEGSPNYLCATDEASDFAITVDAHSTEVNAEDVKAALLLSNLTDPTRTDESETLEKDVLKVVSDGDGKYTVSAKNGFQAGATYQLEILEDANVPDLTFDEQTKAVVYYNFSIKQDETLSLSLDSEVKYLSVSELSEEDAEKILAYTGLYQAEVDGETGEITYKPTNEVGTFTYKKGAFLAGDIIAVYEGKRPDKRDVDSPLNEKVSYLEITLVEGTTYSYKSAEAEDVLFTPDIIPVDIDDGDGVTDWNEEEHTFHIETALLDFTTGYEDMGLDFTTVVEEGDYVAFYSGEYGKEDAVTDGYGRILYVTKGDELTTICYEEATYEEVMASMDMYKESDLSKEQLASIDEQMIVSAAEEQVLESGFAEEAGMYLATMAVETDEVRDLLGESELEIKDCILTYEDGSPVPTEEEMVLANYNAGANSPEVDVKVSKNLVHFKNATGFRVEIALKYSFAVQKKGSSKKISVNMTAIFETEIYLKFSAQGGAEWRVKWIFPYIYDYRMSGNIDQGLYSGIAITATAQLSEDPVSYGPELLEPEGLTDYAQKLVDLSEAIKNKMEESKQAESNGTASGGLVEKYKEFIDRASDSWIELVSVPIFESSGNLDPYYITAYSINIDFVISANLNVAIGTSFRYEKQQRNTFTLRVFHKNESSARTIDISPENYQFDFYVMGTLGIRAGIRAKVLFGLFSTKLAGIGLQLEAGVYAELYGYFYYCLSWEKGKGKESSAIGALLIEIGAYLDVKLAMEVLSGTYSYTPTLYSHEWPIWNVGERINVLDFAYDEDRNWIDSEWKGSKLPTSFEMVREKEMTIPTEVFRMKYLDLKDGDDGFGSYDGEKRAGRDAESAEYDDEENFFVEMSNPAFVYNPVDNTITVNVAEGRHSCEGIMTITWKKPDFVYLSKPISRSFELSWIDPDAGKCLSFDSKGGTEIRTKVYDPGAEIAEEDRPKDEEMLKVGYVFGGWYTDKAYAEESKVSVPKVMPDYDLTLYAKWIPIPNEYTVRFYSENLNTKYELIDTKLQQYNGDGTRVYTDDPLSQEKIVADNFPNDEVSIPHGFEVDKNKTTLETSVAPDGSTVVDIYYKRQIHSVVYSLGELRDEENPDTTIRYRYEEQLIMPTFFMPGYEFKGWDKECLPTMDVDDLSYTAQWEPNKNTPYYIEYYIRKPGTDSYVMLGGDNGKLYKEGETGAEVKAEEFLLEDVGYSLDKIVINGVETDASGSGKIDAYGKLLIQYYYEGQTYDIEYDTVGGKLLNSANVEKQYTHGFKMSLDDVRAEREGYNFIGWLEGEESIDEITLFRVGDIKLKAEWRASTKKLYLYDEDGASLGKVDVTYDEMVPSLPESEIPQKAGYDFAGYYAEDGTFYYDASGNGMVLWQGDKDINLNASWTPVKVELSFDVNGGDSAVSSIQGNYMDNYPTLPKAERAGYHLLGWTWEGYSTTYYVTPDMIIDNYEPQTLVAQWAPDTDTPYVVEHYVERISEEGTSEYELYSAQEFSGTTDTTVSVDRDSYGIPGYTFEPSNEACVLSDKIKPDGSTVLKMYYRKGKCCSVTYNYGMDIPPKTEMLVEGTYMNLPVYEEGLVNNMKLTGWKADNIFYETSASYCVDDDVEFTAVWEKATYQISYRNNHPSSNMENFKYQTLTYDTPSKVMNNLFTITPVQDEETGEYTKYYEFKGWNTKQDGTGDWYYPGEELLNVYDRLEDYYNEAGFLYAQWEEKAVPDGMVPYYVFYNIEDESGMHRAEDYLILFGKEGATTEASAFEIENTKAQPFEQKTIKFGEEAEVVTGYEYYEGYTVVIIDYDRDKYTLNLEFEGGQCNYYGDEYKDNLSEEITCGGGIGNIAALQPEKAGYIFLGWDVRIPDYMPTHNITAVAQFKENTSCPVKVEYYTRNLEDDEYTLVSSDTVYGEKGTTITPEPIPFDGFTAPEAQAVTVLEDGSAVCRYYYERNEYTLAWNAGVGEMSGEDYTQGTVKYGAKITAPSLSRMGYEGSWAAFTGTMPAQNIIYKAEWKAKTVEYHIMYSKQESNGSYTTLYSLRREAKTGTILRLSANLPEEYAAEVEKGYRKPLEQIVEIAGDGSTIIYFNYDLYKSYVNYDFAGGTPTTSNYAPEGEYYYGKTVQLPVLNQVEKAGSEAIGWYDISDPDQTIVDGTTVTIGETDTTYRLKWKKKTYKITYDLGDGIDEEMPTLPNNLTGYESGLDFNIAPAVCNGLAFDRWVWNGDGEIPDGVVILDNGLVHVTAEAAADISLKAEWTVETRIFAAAMYDEQNAPAYLYDYPAIRKSTITLAEIADPQRDGYLFSYWTKKVVKEDYGYYTVILDDDTKVSSLNLNTDFVTASWLKLSKYNGKTCIHVNSEKELRIAIEYMKSNSEYKGIILDSDIVIGSLTEPLMDVWKDEYVFLGNTHRLCYNSAGNISASLFEENRGRIEKIIFIGNGSTASIETATDDGKSAFGALVNKNYGVITGLATGTHSYVKSSANYVGGIVGYNEGIIENCQVNIRVRWDDQKASAEGKDLGSIGGIVGYNAVKGRIMRCTVVSGAVQPLSGYLQDTSQKAYMGGIAGINEGKIQETSVHVSHIGNAEDIDNKETGYLCAGGIAGIDAELGTEVGESVKGIYQCIVSSVHVRSEDVAGGVIGECNYSELQANELNYVSIRSMHGTAGLFAGIYRSDDYLAGFHSITEGYMYTKDGTVGVIGQCDHTADAEPGSIGIILEKVRIKNTSDEETISGLKQYVWNGENQTESFIKKNTWVEEEY